MRLAAGMKSLCRWAVRLDQTSSECLLLGHLYFQPGKSIKVSINNFEKIWLQKFELKLQLELTVDMNISFKEAWLYGGHMRRGSKRTGLSKNA